MVLQRGIPAPVCGLADPGEKVAVQFGDAEVTAVARKEGGVSFTLLAKALPFPTDPAAKAVLELLPIAKDLNQEMVSVRGLVAGHYELKIDGAVVGRYSAQDLEHGINLAFNEATPQFKQAQTVARSNARRRDVESQACSLLNTRRWMQSHYKINPDEPAGVQAHYDSFKDKTEYNAVMALNYIKKWPQYGELRKQVTAHEQEALASRQPVAHTYEVLVAH